MQWNLDYNLDKLLFGFKTLTTRTINSGRITYPSKHHHILHFHLPTLSPKLQQFHQTITNLHHHRPLFRRLNTTVTTRSRCHIPTGHTRSPTSIVHGGPLSLGGVLYTVSFKCFILYSHFHILFFFIIFLLLIVSISWFVYYGFFKPTLF